MPDIAIGQKSRLDPSEIIDLSHRVKQGDYTMSDLHHLEYLCNPVLRAVDHTKVEQSHHHLIPLSTMLSTISSALFCTFNTSVLEKKPLERLCTYLCSMK